MKDEKIKQLIVFAKGASNKATTPAIIELI